MCEEEETLKSELKHKIDQYRDEAMVLFNELGMEADLVRHRYIVDLHVTAHFLCNSVSFVHVCLSARLSACLSLWICCMSVCLSAFM